MITRFKTIKYVTKEKNEFNIKNIIMKIEKNYIYNENNNFIQVNYYIGENNNCSNND